MGIKFEKAMPYSITIDPSENNGFIMRIGCVQLVYTKTIELLDDLRSYILNPVLLEKQYRMYKDQGPQDVVEETETTISSRLE